MGDTILSDILQLNGKFYGNCIVLLFGNMSGADPQYGSHRTFRSSRPTLKKACPQTVDGVQTL